MNSEMQKRLYDMEVTPPQAVWEKLSLTIDEINADNLLAQKVLNAELIPPLSVWEKINSAINVVEETPIPQKRPVINLRKFALAAILVGVIATGWIVFQNINLKPRSVAEVSPGSAEKTSGKETDTARGNNQDEVIDSPINKVPSRDNTSVDIQHNTPVNIRSNPRFKNRNTRTAQSSPVQFASLSTPRAKSFDRSIDDLSLVTSDQQYLTMVNANGRLVKIPAQLASLAPHLQDKPITEDIYEIMFGQGAYWKETLHEWRKKVASAPGASGDAFTSFIELLKSVQDK